jgi:hypothetical protein
MYISGRAAAVALPDGAFVVTNLDTSVCVRLDGPAAAIWAECTEQGSAEISPEQRDVADVLRAQGLLVDRRDADR